MSDQRLRFDGAQLIGLVLFIFLFGLFFRLNDFSLQLFADDEWHSINKFLNDDVAGIFMSFGHADHSIPLTLFYAALSKFTPLTETLMRLPLLISGLMAIVVIPWMLRSKVEAGAAVWLSVLLALSPILIYFSRTARPYALTVLLAFFSIMIFFAWFRDRKSYQAILYIVMSTLCAWLQPITLAILGAPFIYFGVGAIYKLMAKRDAKDFVSLFFLGCGLLLALMLSIGPPLLNDYASLAVKAGVDSVSYHSLYVSLQLLAGSANAVFVLLWVGFMLIGLYQLFSRDPLFAGYLLFAALFSVVLIILSRAAWIHHPLVTARYALPILPILLVWVAVGLHWVIRQVSFERRSITLGMSLLVVVLLYLGGPLPRQYHQSINQFSGHMAYQFDYDWQASVYNQALDNQNTSSFYHGLANQEPRSRHLVLAPWFMEWHWNRWYLDQIVHQQRVSAGFLSGFCVDKMYGEYPADFSRINFSNVRHLRDLSSAGHVDAWDDVDFLVYYKLKPRKELDMDIPTDCLDRLKSVLGDGYYEDDILVVFRIKS